jgi:phosphoribosyl 1,2-cyclic phosphodiesterase
MLEVTVLASGSAGNSMLVRAGSTAVLVDAGLSARQLTTRLAECGQRVEELAGVLLTHEHGDHTTALKVLCSRLDLPIYCNPMTAAALRDGPLDGFQNWRFFENGTVFAAGALTVEAFSVPHDAVDPVGFVIANGSSSLGVLTDLGFATNSAVDRLRGVDVLLIETNHDERMLQNDTRRPWPVKQRILSRHGHLSNAAAAAVVRQLAEGALSHVITGHLSRDCNRAELAVAEVEKELAALGRADIVVSCAQQDAVGPKHVLHGRRFTPESR